jgi:hypothetical protein
MGRDIEGPIEGIYMSAWSSSRDTMKDHEKKAMTGAMMAARKIPTTRTCYLDLHGHKQLFYYGAVLRRQT